MSMILTSRRDEEVLVMWTTFDFFRPVLIDYINIAMFKANDTSRCKYTGSGFKGMGMGLVVGHLCFSRTHF